MIWLILFIGLVLRFISINQSLWLDEATSILAARDFSVKELLTIFSPGDFHPPLYYLLLKVWISIFGTSEIVARSLSVLFGIATIPILYLIGKKLFGHATGLVAAFFLATAPLHIYYSQEARMYVPTTFFATTAVFFFLSILQEKRVRNSLWVGFITSSAFLIYIDYLPILLFGFFAVHLLFVEKKKLIILGKEWIVSLISVAVLFFPWIPTLFFQLQTGLLVKVNAPEWWKVLGRTSVKELLLVPVKFTIGRISSYDKIFYVSSLVLPSILFGLLFLRSLTFWNKTKFVWIWLIIPIVIAALLGIWLSVFSYFRLLFVLPAFYLLLAASSLSIKKDFLRIVAVSGVIIVNLVATSIYLLNPRFHREDWRGAVSFIEENSRENSAAIFVTKNQRDPYRYYSKAVPSYGPEGLEQEFSKVWLVRYVQPIFDPQDQLRQKLEKIGYRKLSERDFNGVVIWEYEK